MTSYIPSLLVPDSALSVAGLTAYIQALLEQDSHLRQVWVTGEVSSASRYRRGLFFTLQDPDAQAAIKAFEQVVQINPQNLDALINLGLAFADLKNDREAMRWYRKAAEQGDATAQYNIGLLYDEGLGVQKNGEEARKWIQKAADQGYLSAKEWLKRHPR